MTPAILEFPSPLHRWAFSRREKRFFIYGTEEGQVAHCPNTGSMKGVLDTASHVWVRDHGPDSGRKLRYTAELAEMRDGALVVINTGHANTLAALALEAGMVEAFPQVQALRREVKYSAETRFDIAFTTPENAQVWVEVKNVTMAQGEGPEKVALFPDAVTTRGAKHLETLTEIVRQGGQALQVYMVSRPDCTVFRPADAIDPAYGQALRAAMEAGVQVVALRCEVAKNEIGVCQPLPVML